MNTEKLKDRITEILPDRGMDPASQASRAEAVEVEANSVKAAQEARALAKIRSAERARLRRKEAKQAEAAKLGIPISEGQSLAQAKKIAEAKARVEAVEEIEAQTVDPLDVRSVAARAGGRASKDLLNKALQLQGASRPELSSLMASLGINLSVRLTKSDTANLLACLLLCNETQMEAMLSDGRVPIIIKTAIRRLLEDMRVGDLSTITLLWDRLFGKGPMTLDLPDQQQLRTGIIPDTPVSREAYVLIRDTFTK